MEQGEPNPNDNVESLVRKELDQPNPNHEKVEELFRLPYPLSWPSDFYSALAELIRNPKGGSEKTPLAPNTPDLLVVRPKDSRYDPLSNRLRAYLDMLLERRVDRDKIELLPFVYSTDGIAKINNEISKRRLVGTTSVLLECITTGDFVHLDANMFKDLYGKTVIVVGHITYRGGSAAFEVHTINGASKYVPIAALRMASAEIGFNLIPIGCETGEVATIGTVTKISDIDALDGFERAIARKGITSYRELLADISAPALRISIDLAKLSDKDIIPIDLIDQDGRQYTPSGAAGGAASQSQQPTASYGYSEITFTDTNPPPPGCKISPRLLHRSQWCVAMLPDIEHWWWLIYTTIIIFGWVVFIAETTFIHVLPVAERISILRDMSAGMIMFYLISNIIESMILSFGDITYGGFGMVIFLIVLGIFFVYSFVIVRYTPELADYWYARLIFSSIVCWARIPILIKFGSLLCGRVCYLVNPAPL